jgi:hypothetical protein
MSAATVFAMPAGIDAQPAGLGGRRDAHSNSPLVFTRAARNPRCIGAVVRMISSIARPRPSAAVRQ